jgi:hypothetical protein
MRRATLALLALLVSTAAAAQGKFPLGFGGGTFNPSAGTEDTVKPVAFAHAIAYAAFDGGDRSKPVTVVLVSTAPIDESRARDDDHLAAEAKAGKLVALQIRLNDADGRVLQHAAFDARGRTAFEAPEKATFTKYAFFFTRVEGQVHFFPQPDMSVPIQRGYMAIFNARVRQGPWREPGEATGTVRLGARTFEVRHASMIEEETQTTVVLSGEQVWDLHDREEVARLADVGGYAVLWATVNNDGKVVESRCLGPGAAAAGVEAAGLDWRREDWSTGLMRGALVSAKPSPDAACVADAYFAAAR